MYLKCTRVFVRVCVCACVFVCVSRAIFSCKSERDLQEGQRLAGHPEGN